MPGLFLSLLVLFLKTAALSMVSSYPENLFIFDKTSYSSNAYHGRVCLTNDTKYIPACLTNYDGTLELGLHSSHQLNSVPEWVDTTVERDNQTFWLTAPKWEYVEANGPCLPLDLPMVATTPAPDIFVTWVCLCKEVELKMCLFKNEFPAISTTTTTTPGAPALVKKSLSRSESYSPQSESDESLSENVTYTNKDFIWATCNLLGQICNTISKTTPLPKSRSVIECVFLCVQFTNAANNMKCPGVFYWSVTGTCLVVFSYGKTKDVIVKDQCEYVRVIEYYV